ncbi:hypothetical protein P691DRAFT_760308 [Macrolepiota fuliginosa MF-IS2]|uniref:Uncharacterized protein n=1 Tax=Macrolepiota fuliginosa MF-IS2 TaxID=1400762 RepID=A0A9P5XC57_9AGAR|nr:hypothetical protein P691DRAFT_760308 [Macrolepiota fuliginosa MF-IS2]
MLRCHNAQLLEVSYPTGLFSGRQFFQSVTQFPSLRSLILKATNHRDMFGAGHQLDATHIAALQHLTHLNTLAVDMGLVNCTLESILQAFGYQLTGLSNSELRGTWKAIRTCLFSCNITFDSLLSLSLSFVRGDIQLEHPGPNLFSLISFACPTIESLSFDGPDLNGNDTWTSITGTSLEDIFGLGERNLKYIHLHHISAQPSVSLVRRFLKTLANAQKIISCAKAATEG